MDKRLAEKYDVVIIGSGMGGLTCGLILAMEGKSVCILEKNPQIGGSLQTFKRDGVKFDTGVHYVGALNKGQPLNRYFKYLGIMDDLTLEKMDVDGYDNVSFGNEGILYPHAQGSENFVTRLLKYFPEEKEGLNKYIKTIAETCDAFSLYNLSDVANTQNEIGLFDKSAKEVINSCTENKKLRNVLAGVNMLYAGNGAKAPFYIHALIVNHYMLSAYRFPNGGDQIGKLLEKRIRKLGGKVIRNAEVSSLTINEGLISKARLKDGREIGAEVFISSMHPQETLKIIDGPGLRKSYVNRVMNLKNTSASFILYVVLKEKTLPYKKHNVYHFNSPDVWDSDNNVGEQWGRDFAVFYSRSKKNPEYCESISIMTYMKFEEVEPWVDTVNVRHEEKNRGKGYDEFKEKKSNLLLDYASVLIPDIRNFIQSYYSSTPLTHRDYLNVSDGSIYGIERDFNNPLNTYINTKTRVKNLYMTGQNLIMHGILGVTVGAVVSCSEILGRAYLMKKIKAKSGGL